MATCSVKYLKAVDGNPVGREVTGVERDAMVEKWEQMGLIRVIDDPVTAPEQPLAAPEIDAEPVEEPEKGAPPESARKAVWAAFLDSEGIDPGPDATKREMIEAWEHASG